MPDTLLCSDLFICDSLADLVSIVPVHFFIDNSCHLERQFLALMLVR